MDCRWLDTAFRSRALGLTPRRFRLAGLAVGLLLGAVGLLQAFEDQTAARLPVDAGGLYAVTAVDVDGDRDADLVLATQAGLRLLLNNGAGAFTDVSAARLPALTAAFLAVAAGDVDGDGDTDLFTASADGDSRLLINNGSGTFTDASTTRLPAVVSIATDAVLVDVDQDGDLDLVIACRDHADRLLLNNGAGVFAAAPSGRLPAAVGATSGVAAADLNADGRPDLVFSREDAAPRLLLNDGSGAFTDASASALPAGLPGALAVTAADMDGDGDLDLVLAGGAAGLGLLRNDGAGHFVAVAPTAAPLPAHFAAQIAVADLNEDGAPDVAVACAGQNRVLLNTGAGVLVDATATALAVDTERTFGVLAVDVDGDLDLDLVLARPDQQTRLLINPIAFPRLRLTAQPSLVEVGQTVAIHVAAFDEDGIATLTATVNGADLPLTAGGASYVPAAPGLYTVAATATDTLANSGTRQTTFRAVTNIVPVVHAGPDATALKGQAFTGSGSFTDPGTNTWTGTVDYGDGSGVQALALATDKTFQLSHAYTTFGVFTVTVAVNDGTDTGTDTLGVTVTNQPPVVSAIPAQVVQTPLHFATLNLDDYVTDPDHPDAEIAWTATGNTALTVTISAARVATVTYGTGVTASETITFTATDPAGVAASSSAVFSVVEFSGDALRPVVTLVATPPNVNVGVPVALSMTVTDASPILSKSLDINGVPVTLHAAGGSFTATFTSPLAGVFTAAARALDNAGNEGYAEVEIRVVMPGDTTSPVAAISAPADDTVLVGPTTLTGTATDANFVRYTLAYSPKDENAFVVFAIGATAVSNAGLGELDPTLLNDGLYDVRLTVEDASGNTTTAWGRYAVQGGAKVGDVKFRLVDLTLPVAGMDLSIYRAYDSRNKTKGDFGVGWTLASGDITVQESSVAGDGWSIGKSGGFLPTYYFIEDVAHTVTVRYPSHHTERYSMRLDPEQQLLYPYETATAWWEAVPGTFSTLTALADNDLWVLSGQPGPASLLDSGFEPYDPDRYRVQTRDGYTLVVSQGSGLESITDPSGNTLAFNPGGISSSAGRSAVFERDAENRITRVTDPAGGVILYQYDAYGDLVAVTDRTGGVTTYTYDRKHNLIRIIDARGNILQQHEFDDEGRLIGILGPNGSTTTFDHDLDNRTEIVTDRLGNPTTMKYDVAGNITELTDPAGGVHRYTYDAMNNRTSTTDPLGNTTTFAYNSLEQVTQKVDPLGNTWTYTYDASGNLLTTTDPEGNVQTSSYDAKGHILSFDDGAGGQFTNAYDGNGNLTSFTDLNGNASQLTFGAAGQLTGWTAPNGVSATVTTNPLGRITGEQYTVQTPGGPQVVSYSYNADAAGRVTEVRGPHGAVTRTAYDEVGAYTSVGDDSGQGVNLDYDRSGRVTGVALGGGNSLSYTYDAEGRMTRSAGSDGTVIERAYDGLGRVIRQKAPDGSETWRSYDAAGRIATTTDPLGRVTHYEYDAAGRPVKVVDPKGSQALSEYNGNGHLTARVDPTGVRTEYDRDAKGRATAVRLPGGTAVTLHYDGEGNVSQSVDALGNIASWTYDGTGLLQQVTDALSHTTTYTRNEEGSLTGITDASGNRTALLNDRYRRMIGQTLPLGQTESRTYDSNGHLVGRTDFAGAVSTFTYGANGLLSGRTAADGTTHAFTYAASGRMTSATNENGTWQYQYDAVGRYTRIIEPNGRDVRYTYDAAGRLTAITTPSGVTSYAYDELGRMVGMLDPAGRQATWAYDAASRLTASAHANGTSTQYTYDARGLLAAVTDRSAGATVLFSETYTRDLNGRITRADRDDGTRTDYVYNGVGWLLSETLTPAGGGAAQVTSYTYDAVGNRLTVTDGAGPRAVVCDANGRLLSDGATTYTYDGNGNVTRRSGAGETLDFAYDGFGKLTGVTRTGGTGPHSIEYRYDPLGALVARVVDGVLETYLVDRVAPFSRVLEEADASGTVTARNFFGPRLETREVGGAWSVLHADHLGSVRLVTGAAGLPGSRYDYDAFGNPRTVVTDSNPYRFAGEVYDAAIGAVNLRARFYWPQAGRFLQMDPAAPDVSDARTLHRYLYAGNDPVSLIDPSGRQFDMVSLMVGISISTDLMGTFYKAEASMLFVVFAMAGGFEIFDFPGDPDAYMLGRGGVQLAGMGLAYEKWNFVDVPNGQAAFGSSGFSLPFDILSGSVGLITNFKAWEAPTPPGGEGPQMGFSFSASYAYDLKARIPRLPVGVGVAGSIEMSFSVMPSTDADPDSSTYGTSLQSHSIGYGVTASASYGGGGASAGVGWSFANLWLIWAKDGKWCGNTAWNPVFGDQVAP